MTDDKVVISSLGIVSPLGSDMDAALEKIRSGETGIKSDHSLTDDEIPLATVEGFNATDYIAKNKARRMDKVNCYAIGAAHRALENAKLTDQQRSRCGVVVGTGFSGFNSVVNHQSRLLKDGIEKLTPIHFPTTVYNATAGLVAIELGLRGANTTVTGLDVSGEYALLYAYLLIKRKVFSHILVIASDELTNHLVHGFNSLGFISTSTDNISRPYAVKRDGMVMGEGATAFLLELNSSAQERGAEVLAEVSGIGSYTVSDSVFGHTNNSDGITQSVEQVLQKTARSAQQVSWVSSTANASKLLDAVEIKAIKKLFNPAHTAVSAFKDYIGDFSSSGLMRMALSMSCLKQGFVPTARNSIEVEEGIRDYLVSDKPASCPDHVLHVSNGIGGNGIAVMLDIPANA